MGNVPIAIEVQISTLTMDQIVYRTKEYARKGIHLLWLPDLQPSTWRLTGIARSYGKDGFMPSTSVAFTTGWEGFSLA